MSAGPRHHKGRGRALLLAAPRPQARQAAKAAKVAVARDDLACRWSAVCDAVLGWAQADPDDCVLIDDTLVPGYIAPPAMTEPAARVSFRPLPPEGNGLIMANGGSGRMHFRWTGRQRRMT